MTTQYVTLPLFDDYEYSYTIALQNLTYIITFKYNERNALWFMDLATEDSTPIFSGLGVVPNYPMAFDYSLGNLQGYFWLENIPDINIEQYKLFPDKLRQYYRFFYIFEE